MYIYAVCHGVSEVDYGYCDTYTVYRVYDNETDAIREMERQAISAFEGKLKIEGWAIYNPNNLKEKIYVTDFEVNA